MLPQKSLQYVTTSNVLDSPDRHVSSCQRMLYEDNDHIARIQRAVTEGVNPKSPKHQGM